MKAGVMAGSQALEQAGFRIARVLKKHMWIPVEVALGVRGEAGKAAAAKAGGDAREEGAVGRVKGKSERAGREGCRGWLA